MHRAGASRSKTLKKLKVDFFPIEVVAVLPCCHILSVGDIVFISWFSLILRLLERS